MKRRNVMVTILLALIALFGAFAFASCGGGDETPVAEGPETGEYYCDAQSGAEYTISLHDGDKVDFKVQNYDLSGTYSVSGENLSFSFEAEPRTVTASLRDDVLTVTLGSDVMRFWKKIDYSVVYMSDGAQYKTETVVNGRTAPRPDDPVRTGYTFIEWYSDSKYHDLYDFSQPVRGNLTLYARFEAPIEPEFDVTLDYNGGTVTGPTTVETVGGKLYKLPKPTRDGYTFAGWWVSHFNSAEKLTYRYEEQPINEPITLYAVWSDGETPLVSIYEDGLRWSADGVNNSYRVKFTGPSGEEITNRSYGTTSYSYDFSQKTAGTYTAEVTLNGKTAKAYYNNKALAAVSAWSIDNSLFRWNAVPHAESYTLSVECGDPNHVHNGTVVSADGELKFDFSGCDMPADGIKFTVTANAEGYLSSTSKPFHVKRTLDKVQNIAVDEATATLSWAAVNNATGYVVSVLQDGESEPTVYTVGAGDLSCDLRTLERGNYTVTVQPTARGWLSPDASAYSYQKARLASPSNIRVEGLSVVWDAPQGADSYTVTINGATYTTDAPSYDLKDIVIGSGITVSVVAQKRGEPAISSPASMALTIKNGTMGAVKYDKGTAQWDAVLGATEYVVKVNENGAEQTVAATSLAVTLTQKENVIYVRAILDNGSRTDWATCTVTAHAIEFDVNDGNVAVDSLYFAEGDTVTGLPEGYRTGYDFDAWYTEKDGGESYTGGTMGNVDLTLHAHWTAKKYTITFNPGTYGTLDKLTFEVTYDQMYTLPVPESSNPTKAFAAWRTEPSGAGQPYTNYDGNSHNKWNDTRNITLYAQWVEIFEFTLNPEKTGWSVSKGEGIQYVRKVTIPEEYGDATSDGMKPVTMVNDFSSCTLLEEINIPARVRNISLGGTQGVAFMGCTNLKAVNIYMGKYNDDLVYESEDGVLLYNNNESTGTKELVFYPLGKTDATYTVPDGVQSILNGVFENAKFTTVNIPASVTLIESDAFDTCASLTDINFLAAGGAADPIEIQERAFNTLRKLKNITLPDRLVTFSSKIFYKCSALENVNLAKTTDDYESKDGMLIKTLGDGTRELAYYPAGKSGAFTVPQGVTSIGADAIAKELQYESSKYAQNTQITKVTIPDWVTNIADGAFMDCIRLAEVEFLGTKDSGELKIGNAAFAYCPLEAITLPVNVTWIGDRAFYGSSSASAPKVTELTLPEGLKHVGKAAFGGHRELKTVTINTACDETSSVFAEDVFALATPNDNDRAAVSSTGDSFVETVTLGDNTYIDITSVLGNAVRTVIITKNNIYYTEDQGVLFNKQMTKISFYPADKTGPFTIPTTIVDIPANLFSGRKQLTGVYIPATVASIGASAFDGCKGLTFVTFTDDVGEGSAAEELLIGDKAFAGCTNLQAIQLPKRTKSIGNSVFDSGSRMRGLTSITLNEGLEEIGAMAFKMTSLTEIKIPSTVTKISEVATNGVPGLHAGDAIVSAFILCDALEKITVAEGNPVYKDIDGVLYKLGSVALTNNGAADLVPTELLYVPMSYHNANGTLEIPNTVNRIWTYAFYELGAKNQYAGNSCNIETIKFQGDTLAEVYNAETLEMELPTLTVDSNAFLNVKSATSVILPEGYKTLKSNTFVGGDASATIASVSLPASLTLIEGRAFYTLRNLTTVIFREPEAGKVRPSLTIGDINGNQATDYGIFNGCKNLTSLVLPEGTVSIGGFAFGALSAPDNGIESVTIPSTVTRIGQYAFGHLSLKEFTFKSSNTASIVLDKGAFEGLTGLQSMSLPTVTSIGQQAFKNSSLSSITFGEKLTSIGESAFEGAALTGRLTLPASLQSIGNNAFAGVMLEEVQFNKATDGHALNIGKGAFLNCTRLGAANLENANISDIGAEAFKNTALKSVALPWTVTTIGESAFADSSALASVTFKTEDGTEGGQTKLRSIGDLAFSFTGLTKFDFPETSEQAITLGEKLFLGCGELTNVYLSKGVSDISSVFAGCASITDITVAEGHPRFKAGEKQKILLDQNGAVMLVYAELTEGEFEVEDGAKEISGNAFRGQIGLKKLILPASLQIIGDSAFEDCINLTTVEFSGVDVSQLQSIGKNAFRNCINLETIDLGRTRNLGSADGSSGVGIGESAFENCFKLQTVDLSGNTEKFTQFGTKAFLNAGRDTTDDKPFDVKFPASITFLNTYTFQGSGLRNADLSGTKLTQISNTANTATATGVVGYSTYTFADCAKLTEVKLPEGFLFIGGYAFCNCAALKVINLDKVQAVGFHAFENCTSLIGNQPEGYGTDPAVKPNCSVDLTSMVKMGKYAFQNSGVLAVKISTTFTPNTTSTSSNDSATFGFAGCAALQSVEIVAGSNKWTIIPQNFFEGCTSLTSFDIPATITKVDQAAFNESGLTGITIPNAVTTVGKGAFANCKSLTTVKFDPKDATHTSALTISDGSTTFNDLVANRGAFEGSGVTNIDWGDRITKFGIRMFYNCKSLISITIPSTVTTINGYAFAGSGLTSIHIPAKVSFATGTSTTSGHQFDGCERLSSVTYEDGFTKVSAYMFANCPLITAFYFPDGVTEIPNGMFQGSGLKSIDDWKDVTTIGRFAFQNTKLTNVIIPAQITIIKNNNSPIDSHAFADCAELQTVTFEADPTTGVTGLKSLEGYLFANCPNLRSVKFAEGITNFGVHTFDDCNNLSLTVKDLPESVTTLDTGIVQMLYAGQQNIVIDDRFTSIAANAFEGMTIHSIKFPAALDNIQTKAFLDATIETDITLPDSLQTVVGAVFQNAKLQNVDLPDGLTSLGDYMFDGSTIKSVVLPKNLEYIGSYSFRNCVDLASVDFNDNTVMTGIYKYDTSKKKAARAVSVFEGCTSLTHIDLPTSITFIGGNATFKGSGLESIDLSKLTGLTCFEDDIGKSYSAGSNANIFENCKHLTEVILPPALTFMNAKTFAGCESLQQIELPATLKKIGNTVFQNTGLTSVNLPALTDIGTGIFSGCADLETVELTEGITKLTGTMFQNCTSLKTINIPASVTSIDATAFQGCGSLLLTQDMIKAEGFSISEDGHYLVKDGTTYAFAVGGNYAEGTLTITASDTLSASMFNGTKMAKLVLEEGITTIPASAFLGIEAEEVVLPTTLTKIGEYAFKASKIGKISIPSAIETLGYQAFESAEIDDLTIESKKAWTYTDKVGTKFYQNTCVFQNAKIGKATFIDGVTIGQNWFDGAELSAEFDISGTAILDAQAFNNAIFAEKLVIPTSVVTINVGAFVGLSAEQVEFDMGDGAPLTIADGTKAADALFGTATFETIVLPERLVSLGAYAFANNTELTHITLPNGLKAIGASAFSGCTALTSVKMPETLATIGANAFNGCTELKNIYIPLKVVSIATTAFAGWDRTCTIYTAMNEYMFYQLFGADLSVVDGIHIEFNVTAEAYEQIMAGE